MNDDATTAEGRPVPDSEPRRESATIASGWYPDPYGEPVGRWWDGQKWTGTIRPIPPRVSQSNKPTEVWWQRPRILLTLVVLLSGVVTLLVFFQIRTTSGDLGGGTEAATNQHTDTRPELLVPNLVGEATEDAIEVLEDLGLQVEVLEAHQSDANEAEPGSIVSQAPQSGTTLAPESVVTLRATPGSIQIPDVLGLDAATAEQELRGLGFHVQQQNRSSASRNPNEVFQIRPTVGQAVNPGSIVTIFVAVEPTPSTPSPDSGTRRVTGTFEVMYEWVFLDRDTCRAMVPTRPRVGQTLVLLGPDGVELSAARIPDGRIERQMCVWDLSFPDVPEVATYRIRYPTGEITHPMPLEVLRGNDWHFYITSR